METPIQVDLGRIAQDLQIRRVQVESVVQLLDEGNTVPFITRYRKERTGGLDERIIREIQLRVGRQRELGERKETILKSIEQQGKLSDDLREAILAADSPKRLEDLYLPFKPKKKTKASEAREKGFEPLALRIWNRDESLTDLSAAAQEFLNAEKGIETVEQVLEGVGHILSESINELAPVRDAVRRIVWRTGKLMTSKAETVAEGQGLDFRDYFNYTEPVNHVPPHRVLAINRGDKEGVLKIRLDVPRQELERALFSQLPLEGHPHQEFFTNAALDALDRLLLPSLEREVRRDLTEMAERHAVEVFARNLRSLLLQPPISQRTVLAIDPGFRTGCKVAVLDAFGTLLEHDVIHPHQPQNRRSEAKQKLKDLVGKHSVGVVAIGNGTACRETEELVAEIIVEGTYFHENPGATELPGAGGPSGEPAAAPATEGSPQEEPAPDPQHSTPQGRADNVESTPEPESPGSPESAPEGAVLASEAPSEGPPQEEPAPDPQHETPQGRIETEGQPATPSGSAQEATADQASGPGSTEGPAQEEPAPDPQQRNEPGGDASADTDSDGNQAQDQEEAGSLPPIRGGAPEDDESSGKDESPAEDAPAPEQSEGQTPIETTPPPDAPPKSEPAGNGSEPAPSESDEGAPASTETVETDTETGSAGDSTLGDAPTPAADVDMVPTPVVAGTAEAADIAPAETVPVQPAEETAIPEAATSATSEGATGEAPATTGEAAPASTEELAPPPAADFTHPPVGPKSRPAKPSGEKPPRPPRSKQPPTPPRPHSADPLLAQLSYVIVNEAGASVYSASPVGREEFPDLDATTRGTISIGRRLQDPLSELVKIEPQNIGVGLYQHDVNPKQLKDSLETVIESCVNFVGVDLNTASVPLLRHVSGLNALTARRLVDRRKEQGPFRERSQIREVEGIGEKTFTQAAGFLKIRDGEHPFDRTWVHPESYEAATKLLEKLGYQPGDILDKEKLAALNARLAEVDLAELARELEVGEPTLRDIAEALARPDRDPREDLPKPIFKRGVLKLEDLHPGMELKGTVLNVVDFGAFVDIGLKDSGLVHISQLANRYVKSPHDVVSVGDVVTVWVLGVDPERKRVSLTMVQPGTERPRGAGGPGGGGGARRGEPREAGARRSGPRPRREGGPSSAGESAPAPREPAGPQRGTRIPGPPARAQQARRGGPRRQGAGARLERPTPSSERPATPAKPRTPPPPPPPLSQEALAGNAPLRTFGQLKQLFEMRTKPTDEESGATEGSPQVEPAPDPQQTTPQARTDSDAGSGGPEQGPDRPAETESAGGEES